MLVSATLLASFQTTKTCAHTQIITFILLTLVLFGGGEQRPLSLCECVLVGGECVPRLAWGGRLPPCCLAPGETCMAAS